MILSMNNAGHTYAELDKQKTCRKHCRPLLPTNERESPGRLVVVQYRQNKMRLVVAEEAYNLNHLRRAQQKERAHPTDQLLVLLMAAISVIKVKAIDNPTFGIHISPARHTILSSIKAFAIYSRVSMFINEQVINGNGPQTQ